MTESGCCVADHLEVNCGEKDDDDGIDVDIVTITMTVTGEDEDGDVHRSHGDASQEATAKTCNPLQIRFGTKNNYCK